jgi:hypothetical protein
MPIEGGFFTDAPTVCSTLDFSLSIDTRT